MKQPERRAQVTYKKPSAINLVSITFFAVIGAICYAGYCYWPTMRLKSNAKSEAQGYLIQFYRMNFRKDKRRNKDMANLEANFRTSLINAGITDPNLKVDISMDPKLVSIDLTFASQFELIGLDKTYPLTHKVHVETSAAAVDW
jgi:hypothetical protein